MSWTQGLTKTSYTRRPRFEGNATVRRTLRVVCEFVYCFHVKFIFDQALVSYALFLISHSFFHAIRI